MKTKIFTRFLAIAFLMLGSFAAKAQCSAFAAWNYVVPITVSNGGPGLGNFQVQITMANTAALVSSGHMSAGGSDIRFADQNCNNLSYWIQNGTFGTSACIIWIKTDTIYPGGTQTLNMYYGNSSAPAASNGNTTFDLFDDFLPASASTNANSQTIPDPTKWNTNLAASNTYSFAAGTSSAPGVMTVAGNGIASATEMLSVASFPSAIIFESNITSISFTNANQTGTIGMAILNNGSAGYTLCDSIETASASPLRFCTATNCGGSWARSSVINATTPSASPTGTWGIAWPANGTEQVSWPGGTYQGTDNSQAISSRVQVAFGALCAGPESFKADWVRVRKYTAVPPSATPGLEFSNLVAISANESATCIGSSLSIPYTTSGVFNTGNVFTAQLSDSTGNFSNPTTIGSITNTSSNTITGTLPAGVIGSNFKIRILSSSPSLTGAPSITSFAINPLPTASLSGSASVCYGGSAPVFSVPVSNTKGATWSLVYSDGTNNHTITGTGNSIALITASNTATTTYSLVSITETSGAGCSNTASGSATVNVVAYPAAYVGGNVAMFAGTSATVGGTAVGSDSYSWTDGTSNTYPATSTITVSPSSTTTYTLTETTAPGCSSSNSVKVTVLPQPTITPETSTSFCAGSSVVLDATYYGAQANYQWYVGSSNNAALATAINGATSISYTATAAGYYFVNVYGGSPVISATSGGTLVTVNPLPTASISGTTSVCYGSAAPSMTISAANTGGSEWSVGYTDGTNNYSATGTGDGSATFTGSNTATTTYSLTGISETNGNGCSNTASGSATVTVNPLPAANAGSSATILQGSSATIGAAAVSGDSYSWTPSTGLSSSTSANPTATPSTTTTYTVTETTASGCTASSPVTVSVNPLTVSTSGYPLTVCLGNTVNLSANAPSGVSYQWSNQNGQISGATSSTYGATASGTYYVTVTNGNATASSTGTIVVINPLAGASVIANTSICNGKSINIGGNAVLLSTYSWTSSATGNTVISTSANPSVTPSSTTTYTLVETNLLGCSGTNNVTITVNPLPAAGAGSNTTIAGGSSTTLGASAVSGSTYSWSPSTGLSSSTVANPTASPATTTTYTVTETNASGCTASNTVTVTVVYPAINVLGNSTNIAAGSTSVSASNATNFGTTATGSSSETYTVQNKGGAPLNISSVKITGTNYSNFSVTASPASSVSAGGSTTFTVTFASAVAGTYNGTVNVNSNDPNTPSYTYAIQATEAAPAINVIGNNNKIIAGSTSVSTTNATNFGTTTTGTSTETYTVQNNGGAPLSISSVKISGANASDFNVTSSPASSVNGNSSTTFTVTFNAASAGTYNGTVTIASNDPNTPSYAYAIQATAAYPAINVQGNSTNITAGSTSVSVSNATNFGTTVTGTSTETYTIQNKGGATLNISSVSIGGANASDFKVTSSPASSVNAGGSTTFTVTFSASATGTYNGTVTVNSNDPNTAAYTYAIQAGSINPSITANGNTSFCDGDSVLLSSSAGPNYQWNDANGPIAGANSQTFYADYASTFYMTMTNGNTTATSNSISVTVNPTPEANAGNAAAICAGGSASIGASAVSGDSYSWSSSPTDNNFNSSIANPTVSPSQSTTYTLLEVTEAGCSNSNSVTVNVNPLPAADAGSNQTILAGSSATIGNTAVGDDTYSWTPAGSLDNASSSNPTATPSATTTYTVTETNDNGCSASHTVTVTVTPITSTVTAGGNTSFCPGGSVTLTETSNAGNYQWYNAGGAISGANSATYTTSVAGSYYAVASNGAASQKSNTVSVAIYSLPTANAGPDESLCQGSSVGIGTSAVSGNSYSWASYSPSAGTTSPIGSSTATTSVSPSATTIYVVTVTNNATGCVNSDTAVVMVNPLPAAVAGSSQTINSGASTSIGGAAVGSDVYAWTSSPSGFTSANANPTVAPTVTTTYTVTETNPATGCKSSNSVTITVVSTTKPTICVSGQTTFCQGGSVKLTASSGTSYQWSNTSGNISGATSQTYYATVSGTYYVTVTTKGASATSAGVTITVIAAPAAYVGGSKSICAGTSVSLGTTAVTGDTYSWTTSNGSSCGGSNKLSTSSEITVAPGSTTSYTLVETNKNGCSASNSATVTVVAKPCVSLASFSNVCANASAFALSGGSPSGGVYTVDGTTATSFNPAAESAGSHTVIYTYTNSTGCSASATKTITVSPAVAQPTISYSGSLTICSGTTLKLTASESGNYGCGSNVTYSWSNANGPLMGCGYSSQSINVSVSGTYYVTVSVNGCSNTSKGVTVTVNPTPTASTCGNINYNYGYDSDPIISGSCNQSNCTYKWSCGATTQKCTVAPTQTTTYYCTTSANGCTSQPASCTVYVNDCHDYNYSDKNYNNECSMCYYNSQKKQYCQAYVCKSNVPAYEKCGYQFGGCSAGSNLANVSADEINIFPNPFTTTTSIRINFVQDEQVKVDVVSMEGRVISTVYEGSVTSGMPYNFTFDGTSFQSGIYIVRIISGNTVQVRKIDLLKN